MLSTIVDMRQRTESRILNAISSMILLLTPKMKLNKRFTYYMFIWRIINILCSYVLEKLKFNLQAKMLLFDKDSFFFCLKLEKEFFFHPNTYDNLYHMTLPNDHIIASCKLNPTLICHLFPCLYIQVSILMFFLPYSSILSVPLGLWWRNQKGKGNKA